MEKIFDGGLKGRSGSVFLTGQPGIGTRFGLPCRSSDQMICTGKTSFLYVLLIKRLLRGQPTFFQTLGGNVYYVSAAVEKIEDPDREVTKHDELQDPSDVVALVDADGRKEIHTPRGVLTCTHNIRVIVASSPRDPDSRRWLKQLNVPEASSARMMDIWSEAELVITAYGSFCLNLPSDQIMFLRAFLHDRDITYTRLIRSIGYFGHSARRIFLTCLGGGGIEHQQTAVQAAISNIPATTSLSNLLSNIKLPNNTSHTLFEMSCDDPERLFINATFLAASTWVLDKLLLAYEARMNDAAWEFYNTVEGSRDAASLQGKIWERQVHNFVQSRTNPLTLTAISLEGQPATTLTWDVPVGVCRQSFDFQSFLCILEDAIQKRTPSYLVPLVPNFPTIDSLLYKLDEPFRALQITKAPRHREDVAGFKRIQQWMKLKSLASPLRPSAAKPWHLVFVVPSGAAQTFSKQSLTGTKTDVGVWAKKIKQFVVELPMEEVLKTSSH